MPNWGRAYLHTWARDIGDPMGCEQFSCAPLQWLGPVDPQEERWLFYLRNPNGGLLQGDQHQIEIRVGAKTHLEIRSQSATRLHPGQSTQTLAIRLEPDSSFIWIPHPLIPGQGADFRQTIRMQMDLGSRLAFADLWTAGRMGMGETWQFQHLHNHLEILVGHHLCWTERFHLDPWLQFWIQSPSILGEYPCWGSLYLFGNWGEVPWTESQTQWRLQRPQGEILRWVGHHSLDGWQQFYELAHHLANRTLHPPQTPLPRSGRKTWAEVHSTGREFF